MSVPGTDDSLRDLLERCAVDAPAPAGELASGAIRGVRRRRLRLVTVATATSVLAVAAVVVRFGDFAVGSHPMSVGADSLGGTSASAPPPACQLRAVGKGGSATAAGPSGKTAHPRPTEVCSDAVRRLNDVLFPALRRTLPASASVRTNLFDPTGPVPLSFIASPSDGHQETYTASVRITNGGSTTTVEAMVSTYDTVPPGDGCPDQARAADLASKGVRTIECGRVTAPNGDVVVVNATAYPAGLGEFSTLLYPSNSVTVYRPDGTVVSIALDTFLEQIPAQVPSGVLPPPLSLNQVREVAGLDGFTLTP